MLAWSFEALRDGGCDPIVIVASEQHFDRVRDAISSSDGVILARGGRSRQESVRSGLAEVTAEIVVIHDAARPFAAPESVRAVCQALARADAAIVAVPLEDTIKLVQDERVVETLNRAGLWRAQTPQAFRTTILREAHERALADGWTATDDAELVERLGGTVAVVGGTSRNIKITRPSDLEIADALAAGEES